jgi:prophage antirepressor-like protein
MPDGTHQPPHQDARATMTSEMQLFTQRIGDHSIAINAMQVNGAPWVRGNDVAVALGYAIPRKAIRDHVDQEDRQTLDDLMEEDSFRILEHNEGSRVYINESGLYSLIMKSKMVHAKLFKRWVTSEVLPSIRQTGQYNAQQPRVILARGQGRMIMRPYLRPMSLRWPAVQECKHLPQHTQRPKQ